MTGPGTQTASNVTERVHLLAAELGESLDGEARFDALARTLYATDASIYEIVPAGVVWPKSVDDVVKTVRLCRQHGVSIIPRGAGTGLTGGAVGGGLQLDLSRHMNRIGRPDIKARTVEVEPGVVLDELNARLAPHGLMFAPDVATASRATIGGMIANNSCGARSVVYGRTVDHLSELTVVLAGGDVVTFHDREGVLHGEPETPVHAAMQGSGAPGLRADTGSSDRASRNDQAYESQPLAARLEGELGRIRDEYYEDIVRRFPRILRSNGGYGLDRLGPSGTGAEAIKILCGSEGTLGIVVRATLTLVPIPRHRALCVLHFDDLLGAMGVVPAILHHGPCAVELIDRTILEAGRLNRILRDRCSFLHGDPEALLLVEFQGDDASVLTSRMEDLVNDDEVMASSYAVSTLTEAGDQRDVWNLRQAGLGLLMSKPGDQRSYAFVEDSAVAPARLRDYIERFRDLLAEEGVEAGYYAHASVGCIHVRPVLNLNEAEDVKRMARIAGAVSDLALEFGGAMTGEHGDGLVRSCWLEKMYGPGIIEAFQKVKRLFDPDRVLNPHKIVDPLPMTEHLRFGPRRGVRAVKTHLDFSGYGGPAGLANMCSGVGACRQRLVGTMCPSYQATNDETHTTRGRANALRVALSDRGLLDGLSDPALAEVMDLCIGCKACKSECPTGVDMARLKAEYLAQQNLRRGVGARARMLADLPRRLQTLSRFPRITNLITRSKPARAWLQAKYGLDARLSPPPLARHTFRSWYRRHRKSRHGVCAPRGTVLYFLDTWTNYFTPAVGIAAVTLLERAGFDVVCPHTKCCGRPAISQGLLGEAKCLAEYNVDRLAAFAEGGGIITGTEPSCTLTLVDEVPQLVRTRSARAVADRVVTIETLLKRILRDRGGALSFRKPVGTLKYHAHCHQKAIVGSGDAVELLAAVWGDRVEEINSGCCGMAGAFGHEVEHYDIARAIGEQRLFPAVRERGDARIAVSGFSCRQQIEHHTGATARHVVEHLADALVADDGA